MDKSSRDASRLSFDSILSNTFLTISYADSRASLSIPRPPTGSNLGSPGATVLPALPRAQITTGVAKLIPKTIADSLAPWMFISRLVQSLVTSFPLSSIVVVLKKPPSRASRSSFILKPCQIAASVSAGAKRGQPEPSAATMPAPSMVPNLGNSSLMSGALRPGSYR